jgi:hypothetical protein
MLEVSPGFDSDQNRTARVAMEVAASVGKQRLLRL